MANESSDENRLARAMRDVGDEIENDIGKLAKAGAVRLRPVPPKTTDAILAERGAVYGEFQDVASTAQALKIIMRQTKNWGKLRASQAEALESLQTKVARILNGDPDHADSWADAAGYPRLIENEIQNR